MNAISAFVCDACQLKRVDAATLSRSTVVRCECVKTIINNELCVKGQQPRLVCLLFNHLLVLLLEIDNATK